MKIILKNTVTIVLFLTAILFIGSSCGDDTPTPAPPEDPCNYQGLSYTLPSASYEYLIPEEDLNTQFFPNASNGPYGNPGIEIAGTDTNGQFMFFTTNVITEDETGAVLSFTIDGVEVPGVTVTCTKAGALVGDEVRYVVHKSGAVIEFCVVIDEVL